MWRPGLPRRPRTKVNVVARPTTMATQEDQCGGLACARWPGRRMKVAAQPAHTASGEGSVAAQPEHHGFAANNVAARLAHNPERRSPAIATRARPCQTCGSARLRRGTELRCLEAPLVPHRGSSTGTTTSSGAGATRQLL